MSFETVIFQSAGSLAVAVLALFMTMLQTIFFIRRPQFTWYLWGAAISFSALIYSVGIFIEYNTSQGPLNHFSGLLEWTAVICFIHVLYGFTFAYLGIKSNAYHVFAGIFHGILLVLLWSTGLFVAHSFVVRHFANLASPYIEAGLGPLGPFFILYAVASTVIAMIIWVRNNRAAPKYRAIYLAGMGVWILLGIHDGLAAMGLSTSHYLMEYGSMAFTIAVLWVVSNDFLEVAAQEKYRVITEFANDCILVIQDGKLVFGNPACNKLIGRSVSDWGTSDFLDLMPPEDQKKVIEHASDLLKGSTVPDSYVISVRNTSGEERFVEITSSVIQYRARPAVLAIARDITARRVAEKSLRDSEEKYRSMMDAMSDSVYICSADFQITYMNPAMIRMVGRDATGESCHSAIFAEDAQCAWCPWDESREDEISETEMIHSRKDRSYHVTHSPIFRENDLVLHMIILKDITLTKQLQQQVLRSERLSVTGQLAATIAHQINSPLQGVLSLVNSIERSYARDEQLSQKINLIRQGFEKIRDTMRRLLDLNRPGKEAKQFVNVNSIIEDTLGLLQSYLLKNHVNMDVALSSITPTIYASSQQLGHVFMNLITNAVEAMTGMTKSDGAGEKSEPAERRIAVSSEVDGGMIIIKVSDTGPGILEEDLEQLFDFFYTRKKEKGMGIGLAVCHGIIESHHGSISALNAPDGGAVFTIKLPIE